ncbi:MAG: redoxin domain-containing protein [Planctomycetes bacterium]|nr:redoxin domain-containing protein [Planctomycetota bacterium]
MARVYGLTVTLLLMAAAPAGAQIPGVASASSGPTLSLGDAAPALEIAAWIKGDPVDLAKGLNKNIYVVEFWATWCPPCVQSIPHLTDIQKRYRDKNVVVVSITDEPPPLVTQFVQKQGDKMGYTVACDKEQKTHGSFMYAAGQMSIPTTFIVDRKGKIAWIGSPFDMDRVLEEIVAGRYDIEEAKAEAKFYGKQLNELMLAVERGKWDTCVTIGRDIADPKSNLSNGLRSQVLSTVAWQMLAHELADKKYFKDALELARSGYDICGCEDADIVDTYARALFDNGHTREAVKYQRLAVGFASNMMMKEDFRKSLKKYEEASQGG